jgi:hypothetical protein
MALRADLYQRVLSRLEIKHTLYAVTTNALGMPEPIQVGKRLAHGKGELMKVKGAWEKNRQHLGCCSWGLAKGQGL